MANGFVMAMTGGSDIILLVKGQQGYMITATLGMKSRTGTIDSTGELRLRLPSLGTWTVKVTGTGFSYEQDVNVYNYGITEFLAVTNKKFSECTFDEINSVAKSNLCQKVGWQVGDENIFTTTDKENVTLQIYDFNHDYRADGVSKVPLTLGMKMPFKTQYPMHSTDEFYGSWKNCDFRVKTLPTLKSKFPKELLDIITPCQKATATSTLDGTILKTTDDLFLFSCVEIFGSMPYPWPGEGERYPIFTDNVSWQKGEVNWWLRSPTTNYSTDLAMNTKTIFLAVNSTLPRLPVTPHSPMEAASILFGFGVG